MKTFCYLLDDETNPPQLWEILTRHEAGLLTLRDPRDLNRRLLVAAGDVWEIASF